MLELHLRRPLAAWDLETLRRKSICLLSSIEQQYVEYLNVTSVDAASPRLRLSIKNCIWLDHSCTKTKTDNRNTNTSFSSYGIVHSTGSTSRCTRCKTCGTVV